MKYLCVYCGSRTGTNPEFAEIAEQTGRTIARHNWGVVYGGGKIGMMGKVADAALDEGGAVVGVIPTMLKKAEVVHTRLTDLHETQDMHTRKALMESLSDAFLVLPGGFGTLDEFFEILTWRQLGIHNKPIFLMNVNGYFDGLIQFARHSVQQGYVRKNNLELFQICNDVDSCFKQIEEFLNN